MSANVEMTETGIDAAMTSVVRTLRKKMYRMIAARTAPHSAEFATVDSVKRTYCAGSKITRVSSPGLSASMAASSAITASETRTTFAVDCFKIVIVMLGSPFT